MKNVSKNAEETDFACKMDNGETLGLIEDSKVKYAGVVSRSESIAMKVSITRRQRAAI